MAQSTMETLLTLLAGMGLTQLPKTLKGLGGGGLSMLTGDGSGGGQGLPGASSPPTLPGGASPDVLAPYLQMLAGGSPEGQAGPPPMPPVPRFPQARARPVIPRVANMASQLSL